ncbi:MAG: hypothetical protein JNM93_02825 [Bacteriovoracaceae bacterium]|nr:hypothetical protein [Bacteriovoracaceae bacterium]
MKKKQYTIRNIPESVDNVLKKRSQESGKSFNQVVLEAIIIGAKNKLIPERNFNEIIGSISEKEAKEIEQEVALQRQIDLKLWS